MALTLKKALDCIDKGTAKARELGFSVAIAVVDEAGHLVACHRMDEAFWVTPEIARAKANASAAFRATAQELEERFTKRPLFAGNVASPEGERIRLSGLRASVRGYQSCVSRS